jgi:hypothetical protein
MAQPGTPLNNEKAARSRLVKLELRLREIKTHFTTSEKSHREQNLTNPAQRRAFGQTA